MARILQHFVLATFFSSAFAWRMKSTNNNVIPYVSGDVTLRCDNVMKVSTDEEGTIYHATSIRLFKSQSNSRSSSRWKSVAEINVPDISRVTVVGDFESDVIASGYVGEPSESFLSVTWPTATLKTAGSYQCRVDGVNVKGKELNAATKNITITNSDLPIKDLVTILIQMKVKLTDKIDNLTIARNTQQRDTEVEVESLILDVMNKVTHMSDKLDKLTRAYDTPRRDKDIKTKNQTYEIMNKVKHMISVKLDNLTIAHNTQQRGTEVEIKSQILEAMNKITHTSVKLDNLTAAHEKQQREMDIKTENQTSEIINNVKDMCDKRVDLNRMRANKTLGLDEEDKNQNQTTPLTTSKPIDALPWPTGNYSLPATSDGCPDATPGNQFLHDYITIQAKTTTKPKHATSATNHLSQPFYKRRDSSNILNFQYCTHVSSDNQETLHEPWQKGSYCIRVYTETGCLDKFQYGYLDFYLESMSDMVVTAFNPLHYYYDPSSGSIRFHFCCRKDGNPNNDVILPTSKPFYLYRYGGVCQSVFNMDVTTEWIFLDTDDQKHDYGHAPYPDGSRNDFRLELCYYQKRLP